MALLDSPIAFEPVYQERVWGGRALEAVYGRRLPEPDRLYGESWEMVDRPEAQSVVRIGPAALRGKSLHALWTEHRESVFGPSCVRRSEPSFPLLAKILDARGRLSIQVHPPEEKAEAFGGEAKTEMWYVVRAESGAKLYVGLREGTDRETLARSVREGTTEAYVHAIEPKEGEALFIPSGRLHAIGEGLLLFEIQQNSDTTYRVYDWNRLGSDRKPRALHLREALECIDFSDVEPVMTPAKGDLLADCPFFRVEQRRLLPGRTDHAATADTFALVTVIEGNVCSGEIEFRSGDFFLVPAEATPDVRELRPIGGAASLLVTSLP